MDYVRKKAGKGITPTLAGENRQNFTLILP